jgi:hypothetical protein
VLITDDYSTAPNGRVKWNSANFERLVLRLGRSALAAWVCRECTDRQTARKAWRQSSILLVGDGLFEYSILARADNTEYPGLSERGMGYMSTDLYITCDLSRPVQTGHTQRTACTPCNSVEHGSLTNPLSPRACISPPSPPPPSLFSDGPARSTAPRLPWLVRREADPKRAAVEPTERPAISPSNGLAFAPAA